MNDGTSKRFLRQLNHLSENELNSDSGIALLKDIVQSFVEENDDNNAYRYQTKKCEIVKNIYGAEDIKTERAEMYLRELRIRSVPVYERVKLCRDFWEFTKQRYGENSYAVSKLVAPLYLLCCEQAREYEEMRILCQEIISIYENSDDEDDMQLVMLCKAAEYLYFGADTNVEKLSYLSKSSARLFGAGNETTLILLRSLGLSYRKPNDAESMALCIKTYQMALETAINSLGFNNRITLLLACDLASDFALNNQFKEAIRTANKLEELCNKIDSSVEKPNISNAYFLIYSKMGKRKLAEKYAKKSLQEEIKKYGNGDGDVIDSSIRSCAYAFVNRPNEKNYLDLSTAISDKIDLSFLVFLASSNSDRMAYFTARQNQNYFKIYSIITLEYIKNNALSKDAILSLWENICNRKTFISDCDLIHSEFLRDKEFSDLIEGVKKENGSINKSDVIEIKRKLLDNLREYDYKSYSKKITVKDIVKALNLDELLIDFYISDSIDGQVYTIILANNRAVSYFCLGPTVEIDFLINSLTTSVKDVMNIDIQLQKIGICQLLIANGIDIKEYQTIYVCPDGALYKLPFDVIFKTRVCYLTNPKDIARKSTDNFGTSHKINKVTAFADPKFDLEKEQDSAQERGSALLPLPGTFLEVAVLKTVFGEKTDIYLNEEANVHNFRNAMFGEIVNIGTHANSDGDGKLFFSGINNISNNETVPDFCGKGYLSCSDISELDFSSTELVVLSACGTAAGKYSNYLGIRSISRAFKLAGAKYVVATLWEVNDFSTSVLMKKFYEFYAENRNVAQSMAYAKNYIKTVTVKKFKDDDIPVLSELLIKNGKTDMYRLIRDRLSLCSDNDTIFAHPYYWAGFQVFE